MTDSSIIDSILKAKAPRKLSTSEFSYRRQYYWAYQYSLAKFYLCPQLEEWGFDFKGKRILDVGCGNGGIACAAIDRGASCVGNDIVDLEKPNMGDRPFKFILGDMNDKSIREQLDSKFDLVILRDVIEHIKTKDTFLENILPVLAPHGKVFITFPPYYSPFGGHTQNLRAKIFKAPFLHLLPPSFFKHFVKNIEQPNSARDEVLSLNQIRTTIYGIEKLFDQKRLNIVNRKFYAFRPTFHIRYGLKPFAAFWGSLPFIQELAVTAAFYYLEKRN